MRDEMTMDAVVMIAVTQPRLLPSRRRMHGPSTCGELYITLPSTTS
jgi:hypothetical protein